MTQRGSAVFRILLAAIAAGVATSILRSGQFLAAEPALTGCSIEAFVQRAPEPSFVNEEAVARFSATYVNPTVTAECNIAELVWDWDFIPMAPVEWFNPVTEEWQEDPYRPVINHVSHSNSPDGTLTARFPHSGRWRVTLEVRAKWLSRECTSCDAIGQLTIYFPDVTECSFTGIAIPNIQFDGRSTTRFDVYESGRLEPRFASGTTLVDVKDLSWHITSGTEYLDLVNTPGGDGLATFTAKNRIGRVVLELRSNKMPTPCASTATLSLEIVKPTNVYHTYVTDWAGSGNDGVRVSYGVEDLVHLEPKDVSFVKLFGGEAATDDADVQGVFATDGPNPDPHPMTGPHQLTSGDLADGCMWVETDKCYHENIKIGARKGWHIWNIPQQWIEPDDDRTRHRIRDLEQRGDFDGIRTIRIQKGGVDRSGPQ